MYLARRAGGPKALEQSALANEVPHLERLAFDATIVGDDRAHRRLIAGGHADAIDFAPPNDPIMVLRKPSPAGSLVLASVLLAAKFHVICLAFPRPAAPRQAHSPRTW